MTTNRSTKGRERHRGQVHPAGQRQHRRRPPNPRAALYRFRHNGCSTQTFTEQIQAPLTQDAARVIRQLSALRYMHAENQIVRCDLKPGNILFLREVAAHDHRLRHEQGAAAAQVPDAPVRHALLHGARGDPQQKVQPLVRPVERGRDPLRDALRVPAHLRRSTHTN